MSLMRSEVTHSLKVFQVINSIPVSGALQLNISGAKMHLPISWMFSMSKDDSAHFTDEGVIQVG
jgi:hypothetical protein